MNIESKSEKTMYTKAIFGALVFLFIGILLTSKRVNLNSDSRILILEVFILVLVMIAITLHGYYFISPSDKNEMLKKNLAFGIVLIPTSLVFFVERPFQELFFFFSFFLGIIFILIHQITYKDDNENYLLIFLTSIWTLLGAVILFKDFKILPSRFFNEISFLQLDKIKVIRIVFLILILIHLSLISFVKALKPENKILNIIQIPTLSIFKEIDSYKTLLRPVLWLVNLVILFLNIFLFFANLVFTLVIVILDSILRFGLQILLNLLKVLSSWDTIIFFMLLFIASYGIPFVIKVNSEFLIEYIKGYNANLWLLISQTFLLIGLILIVRILVTFLFCGLKKEKSIGEEKTSLIKNVFNDFKEGFSLYFFNRKVYSNNFTPIIYCLVICVFFISLTSILLTAVTKIAKDILLIEGYNTIGRLTFFSGLLIVLAILLVVPIVLFKWKLRVKQEINNEEYFYFIKLNWHLLLKRKLMIASFVLIIIFCFYYQQIAALYKENLFKLKGLIANSNDKEKLELDIDTNVVLKKNSDTDFSKNKNDDVVNHKNFVEDGSSKLYDQDKIHASNNNDKYDRSLLNRFLNSSLINLKAEEYDAAIIDIKNAVKIKNLPEHIKNKLLIIKTLIMANENIDAVHSINEIINY